MTVCAKSKQKIAMENFKKQIDMLSAAAGIPNLLRLSAEAGMKEYRLYKLLKQPWMMKVGEQWLLSAIFEKYGLTFDPTLGIGGARV